MNAAGVKTGIYYNGAKGSSQPIPATGYNANYLKTQNNNVLPPLNRGTYTFSSRVYGPIAKLRSPPVPATGYNRNYLKTENQNEPYVPQPRTQASARQQLQESAGGEVEEQAFVDKVALLQALIARSSGKKQILLKDLLNRFEAGGATEQDIDDALAMEDSQLLQQLLRANRLSTPPPLEKPEPTVKQEEVEPDDLAAMLQGVEMKTPPPARRKGTRSKKTYLVEFNDGTQKTFTKWGEARYAAGLRSDTTSRQISSTRWTQGSDGKIKIVKPTVAPAVYSPVKALAVPRTNPLFETVGRVLPSAMIPTSKIKD
jgi:hypothetical protein